MHQVHLGKTLADRLGQAVGSGIVMHIDREREALVLGGEGVELPITARQALQRLLAVVADIDQDGDAAHQESSLRTAMKALWGTWTVPIWRIRFLPSFCFSSSLRLRVISPP